MIREDFENIEIIEIAVMGSGTVKEFELEFVATDYCFQLKFRFSLPRYAQKLFFIQFPGEYSLNLPGYSMPKQ